MGALSKTNRLLQIFLAAFLLIAFRIWHLAVQEREDLLFEARRPHRRTLLERGSRGIIEDRFGIPLALNRICYQACVYYGPCAQCPASAWKKTESGERVRTTPRKDYIRSLSAFLGEELGMDPERIEDLIYAKASLFPHIPFVIQSNLTEEQHYRLKAAERHFPGLSAETASERFYPLGKTASHAIGYLGAISQKEYTAFSQELEQLKQMAEAGEDSLLARYHTLQEKAYAFTDLVGKAGLEKQYEELLRGSFGKRIFEIDQKGNCIKELPGKKNALAGQTLTLSLSAELQQYCEELLTDNEQLRDRRSIGIDPADRKRKVLKQPWIKGGAIVALDPNSGEVLALASYPCFDPNDFILLSNREEKLPRLKRWQEGESVIADIWDGKDQLMRERKEGTETAPLTWDTYLQTLLPETGPLRALFKKADDLKSAISLQEDFEALRYHANASAEEVFSCEATQDALPYKKRIDALLGGIPSHKDKLFALDLCRTAVYSPAFTDELIAKMGGMKLPAYRSLVQAFQRVESLAKSRCQSLFHKKDFKLFREAEQKSFLQQKRLEEKARKHYAKPYIDYLDAKEREMFEGLWQQIRYELLAAALLQDPSLLTPSSAPFFDLDLSGLQDLEPLRRSAEALTAEECVQWLKTMRSYRELTRPLLGSYNSLRGARGAQTEKDLAAAFYPIGGFGFTRSFAFQATTPLGSIFKLVTAYAALKQNEAAREFSIVDEVRFDEKRSMIVASTLDRKPYYRHHKGGRLPRSSSPHFGKVDLLLAIEQSSNPYFSLLAHDFLAHPHDLASAANLFGFGEKTGIDVPGEGKGWLPVDLAANPTGLYSFAIGQHTFLSTPLQGVRMLSGLACGGKLPAPRLLKRAKRAQDNASNAFAKHDLAWIGIDFPLFGGHRSPPGVQKEVAAPLPERRIDLPAKIRSQLLEGMDRVVWGQKGSARPSVIKSLYAKPALLRDFLSLQHQMIGKTGTTEITYRPDYNPSCLPQMYKHIWFGSISFVPGSDLKRWDQPELAVIVLLRYGDSGKEAAPLAAQVIRKWREIRQKH